MPTSKRTLEKERALSLLHLSVKSELLTEVLAKTEVQGDCLIWTGQINRGYSSVYIPVKYHRPRSRSQGSRLVLVLTEGCGGLEDYALHSCDNKLCLNPDHLSWGDQFENMQQCSQRGRNYVVPDELKNSTPQAHEAARKYLKVKHSQGLIKRNERGHIIAHN